LPVALKTFEEIRSGGIIRRGQAEAVVSKTGIHTYIGEAVDLVAQQKPHVSNLQKVLIKLSRVLILISFAGVLFIFFWLLFKEMEEITRVLGLALVLLVSSIPVAMQVRERVGACVITFDVQVVSTAVLAIGSQVRDVRQQSVCSHCARVQALAKKKVIVTRLAAIEELAGTTTLCSDKTGTLTKVRVFCF
jgi:H+-transporting ATPase